MFKGYVALDCVHDSIVELCKQEGLATGYIDKFWKLYHKFEDEYTAKKEKQWQENQT